MKTLAEQLAAFAAADLRQARTLGYLLVGQTKRGTVAIRHAAGVYILTTQGLASEVLAQGKPAAVRPVLAALYDVQEA